MYQNEFITKLLLSKAVPNDCPKLNVAESFTDLSFQELRTILPILLLILNGKLPLSQQSEDPMGGFDVFCAFCGVLVGPAPILDAEEIEDGEEQTYDRAIATDEAMAWMDEVRFIGENESCQLQSK